MQVALLMNGGAKDAISKLRRNNDPHCDTVGVITILFPKIKSDKERPKTTFSSKRNNWPESILFGKQLNYTFTIITFKL
jgi:hypothetical protein